MISLLSQVVVSMTLARGAESVTQPEVWRIGDDLVALELGGPWPALCKRSLYSSGDTVIGVELF